MTRLPASTGSCATRSRPETYRLAGPTVPLDGRTHAFRNDLADIALAGTRFAPHYARAEASRCVADGAMLLAAPRPDAPAVSQLVHGEGFQLLDRSGGWAWGRCEHDGYVGYLRDEALGPVGSATHRVTAPVALVFAAPSIKAPVRARLPIGARVAGAGADPFVAIAGGYVHARHLAPLDPAEPDWTAVAERLLGQPYLWGGRGAGGIDCSGLVQVALGACGLACPRDSDQQREALGMPLDDDAPLRRGDLVFFPGHVGIMVDGERTVHANAWWMAVTVEPLAAIARRLAVAGHARPILARRRIAR